MYRTIETSFWTDPDIRQLPAEAKLLSLYLVTNPYTHVGGIYCIPDPMISLETGIPATSLDTLWHTLSSEKFAFRDPITSVVWVRTMFHHQGRGAKNIKAVANHLPSLHKSFLIKDFLAYYPEVAAVLDDRVSDTLFHRASCARALSGTTEQEQNRNRTEPGEDQSISCSSSGDDERISDPSGGDDKPQKKSLDEEAFAGFWELVPNKLAKAAAQTAYVKARQRICKQTGKTPTEAREYLAERMGAFRETPKAKGDFCPYPSTWLNQGSYDDDPAGWQRAGGRAADPRGTQAAMEGYLDGFE